MNSTEREKLENQFTAEMIRCAEENLHLLKLVTSAEVSIHERNNLIVADVKIPLRSQVFINREMLRESAAPLVERLAQRSLVELSLNLHKLGMQVNPISNDTPKMELITDTPIKISLPIIIHHSTQEGQILMHPSDYSNLMRNAFNPVPCFGGYSVIPALINVRL
jgi:hypothetical protein